MDFKTLLPDFNAIGKTEWGKISMDTKNPMNLVMALGAVLMVVFVFLSWSTLVVEDESYTKAGISTWYGVFALIMGLVALVGVLYNHTSLAFCAAVLGLVFGLMGVLIVPEMVIEGEVNSPDEIKDGIKTLKKMGLDCELKHLGAILYMVASGVTAVVAYLKIAKK